MDFFAHNESFESVVKGLKSDVNNGLSSEVAKQKLETEGFNEFQKKAHTSLVVKFLSQFKSFMIIVLIVAAIISGVVGYLNGEGFTDAIIIFVIILLNAVIGVAQEAKAEKSLDALEKMSAPNCKVIRDGKEQIIPSRELVKGDVVLLETGDTIPADLRLVESVNMKVQEAALTGESLPVEKNTEVVAKDAPIGDRANMGFSSCNVTYGRGKGIVVATGEDTEVGKIASMIQSVEDTKTPLQERLDELGKYLAIVALAICALIFIIGVLYGNDILSMFMTAVSLAAAAIPEGFRRCQLLCLPLECSVLPNETQLSEICRQWRRWAVPL
ncbi:MAG: HAD-IC family P-type ATPase [Paludibacteraceae bacterium]|nr:HAD-IC family P-type ATPase [Paludibacteraceae bacterium]